MKRILQLAAILVLLVALNKHASTAFAQGTTAFTYQGQLHDTGTNANGTYTMIFSLYTASSGGTQLGSTLTTSSTLVNGLFTVNLDFGNVFNGSACYLDITVTNGGMTQELSPRVQVLPSPYALYSSSAAGLSSGTWSLGVGTYDDVTDIFGIFNNGSLVMGLTPSNGDFSTGLSIPKIETFDSSGTFDVPPGEGRIMVEVWGGGGGGGGGGNGGTYSEMTYSGGPGGGGGGGGYGKDAISVTPGSSLTVTIGAGGTAGGIGSAGSGGGTTSVSDISGVLISATGGNGGAAGGNSSSGGNGSAGNGGNPGTSTASLSINGVQGGGGPNTAVTASGGSGGVGGAYGSCPGAFGTGQAPGGGGASGAGQYGAAGTAGNSGASGMVVIYY
jgi:hypothetical protein